MISTKDSIVAASTRRIQATEAREDNDCLER